MKKHGENNITVRLEDLPVDIRKKLRCAPGVLGVTLTPQYSDYESRLDALEEKVRALETVDRKTLAELRRRVDAYMSRGRR